MRGTKTGRRCAVTAGISVALLATMLLGCSTVSSTVDRIKGPKAPSDTGVGNMAPEDPLALPVQVGWTSARASYCGFVFNPDQLRADFLASEQRLGAPPDQMQKVERAYDYTRQAVLDKIKGDPNYCNKERTAAIRADLNRYLVGDFSAAARAAR
ncbi:MAG TPA: hypothetical protein VFJ49_04145 [Methyloceanibacter sp.]|nr:hypothetical protein [Methyloceanibacter sp.]